VCAQPDVVPDVVTSEVGDALRFEVVVDRVSHVGERHPRTRRLDGDGRCLEHLLEAVGPLLALA
jgi:hypothetical protein